jgi:uncharacterized NAD-dependent epimerase/dehydratase family protein
MGAIKAPSRSKGSFMTEVRLPYLLFFGDATEEHFAKTGIGVAQWKPDACLGQWRLPGCVVDVGLPDMNPQAAAAAGVGSLLIGVAPVGGQVQANWIEPICAALAAGLDIVSGMHTRLGSVDRIREAATKYSRKLHDLRHSDAIFPVASGQKRLGKRLLTVGTDCALGKKYTALALTRAFTDAGHKATFRATGQTGIMISGAGIAIDAIVSDFIAGAAETLSPSNQADHWDIIEGQGSLLHPGYAGVSLGLLHGSQPDALVLCHDPALKEIVGYPGFAIPPLDEAMALHLSLARRTNPKARFVGIALNTSKLSADDAKQTIGETQAQTGLPTFDPLLSDLRNVVAKAVAEC